MPLVMKKKYLTHRNGDRVLCGKDVLGWQQEQEAWLITFYPHTVSRERVENRGRLHMFQALPQGHTFSSRGLLPKL